MSREPALYNTLGRAAGPLGKPPGSLVTLYTCGPTVYNYLHVGNYRTYVFEDVLKRTLKLLGYKVRHVMNITDVGHLTSQADEGEDKMAVAARREGKTAWDIAKFYEKTFLDDIATLKIDFHPATDPQILENKDAEGDILCRATDHIQEQKDLIERLEKKGLTYKIKDGVYFDTSRFPDYGQLMGLRHHLESKPGARVEVNPEKHSQTDFALWKFAEKGERQMEWGSPWGNGFPGWHIECSAMAMKYLGESFDIHCGGVDHIPIHHTNEIAQSEGASGKRFARIWMHGEFLLMNKAKMAKSSSGFVRLQDLVERGFDPLDFRYFCYTAHYRKQLDFSWEALEAAKTARVRLREKALEACKNASPTATAPAAGAERFAAALADDLNAPEAMGCLRRALSGPGTDESKLAMLKVAERALALGLFEVQKPEALPAALAELFEGYKAARARKDFAESDTLRRKLLESGIKVLDSKEGSRWQRV